MFIDWNHSGQIDPVDIGIGLAAFGAEETEEYDEMERQLTAATAPPDDPPFAKIRKKRG